eukprot:5139520-Pleurochrysis_carterae.AAC.1
MTVHAAWRIARDATRQDAAVQARGGGRARMHPSDGHVRARCERGRVNSHLLRASRDSRCELSPWSECAACNGVNLSMQRCELEHAKV